MYTNPLETIKTVWVCEPQAIKDNAEFVGSSGSTPVTIDTLGFSRMKVVCRVGATDIAMAELKLTGSDVAGSGYADITGATFSPLPSATDDNKSFAIFVKLDGTLPRYYRVTATAGNGSVGTFAVVYADLARGDSTPSTATERGHAAEVFVP
jgi:hypothetical protein